jgi:peptide chain release factor 2
LLDSSVKKLQAFKRSTEDCSGFLELYKELEDESLLSECGIELDKALTNLRSFELERMLSGPHDERNAILEINAGAGGTEAQDWAEILTRMYMRWAEKKSFTIELLEEVPGDGAGIKSTTLLISGMHAFGFLRSERGVHRLVRISPFDSNARRHTSFASVSVLPEMDDDIEIEIRPEDLRVDTYRSGGAGGQHVNKTDSAVRLTHLATGIVVACQNERSQHKNKATAMKLLKSKLYDLEVKKKAEDLNQIAGERKKIDFGSQIRSYVLQPYQMIKDLRTEVESGNVHSVLDGEIDEFIESYLLSEEWNQGM